MAEERICVCKLEGNAKESYCGESITRADAIERIAKEIAREYDPRKPNKEEYKSIWEKELFPGTKKYYREVADKVLNALLGE